MAAFEPKKAAISGFCDPRFSDVKRQFENNFSTRDEIGASVCIHWQGHPVVDLWGGVAKPSTGAQWQEDTVGPIYSCTKGATALCAHLLIDRQALDLDANVGHYWPEYRQAGKGDTTVRMLLSHQAAVPAIRAAVPPERWFDQDEMAQRIASETPFWTPGAQHGYHALTFGILVGELVARLTGQSLGNFFKREIAEPLGLDFWIGLPAEYRDRIAPTLPVSVQPPAEPPLLEIDSELTLAEYVGRDIGNVLDYIERTDYFSSELPAGGGIANARALATMYSPLSLDGALAGTRLVSERAIPHMRYVNSAATHDAVMGISTCFTSGFAKSWHNPNSSPAASYWIGESAFGHPGKGGSLGFADPDAQLSFGYTMNRPHSGMSLDMRGQSLVDAAYRCVGFTSREAGFWIR
jgi:CubicO group peptidase (beta-lactamase class C family)